MSEIMNHILAPSLEAEIDARLDGLVEQIMRDNSNERAIKEYEELVASRVRRMRSVAGRKQTFVQLARKFA